MFLYGISNHNVRNYYFVLYVCTNNKNKSSLYSPHLAQGVNFKDNCLRFAVWNLTCKHHLDSLVQRDFFHA